MSIFSSGVPLPQLDFEQRVTHRRPSDLSEGRLITHQSLTIIERFQTNEKEKFFKDHMLVGQALRDPLRERHKFQ
jgi:hypothetical protein